MSNKGDIVELRITMVFRGTVMISQQFGHMLDRFQCSHRYVTPTVDGENCASLIEPGESRAQGLPSLCLLHARLL